MTTPPEPAVPLHEAMLGGGLGVPVERLAADDRREFDTALNRRLKDELGRLAEGTDPDVARAVEAADVDYPALRDSTLSEVLVALAGASEVTVSDEARSRIMRMPGADVAVADALQLDTPIDENPVLADTLVADRTMKVAAIAGVSGPGLAALVEAGVDVESLTPVVLDDLVDRDVIDADEAKNLSFLGRLSALSGSNLRLLETLTEGGHSSIRDFVDWDAEHWQRLIEDNSIDTPELPGVAADDRTKFYAENLTKAVERTFPSEFLAVRLGKPSFEREVNVIDAVSARVPAGLPLVRHGAVDPDAVDRRGLSSDDVARLDEAVSSLDHIVKTYGPLGIADILNDVRLEPADRAVEAERRLDGFSTFVRNNPGLDFYLADLVDPKIEFDWTDVDETDQPFVRRQARAMQRVATLTDDADHSLALLGAGFSSSASISAVSLQRFLADSGVDRFDAEPIWIRAKDNRIASDHLFAEVAEATAGVFDKLAVANTPNLANDLRELDGYTDLFGGKNYCDCEHCRSVLSPSAYFVDMMKFIDDNVSSRVFVPGRTEHPLHLSRRRPDLWELDLSCRSAKTELPYLQIVNEVLTRFLESELAVADVTAALASAQNSVTLPVNLHSEELHLYLREFDLELATVYELLDQPIAEVRRAQLSMSAEELAVITTADAAGVSARFGGVTSAGMDVQDFMKFAGVTRDEVTALLGVGSLPELANVAIEIVELPDDIQQYAERFAGLTDVRLDLMHRFLRLTRALGHEIADTDLLLESMQQVGLLTDLASTSGGSSALLWVAPVFRIRDALELTVEEMATFIAAIPERASVDGERSLYDRLFDRAGIFGQTGVGPDGLPTFNAQATILADRAQDRISGLVAGGVGVTETELAVLLELHGLDTTTDIVVDHALLSSLYRHARMARGLGVSVDQLVGLIRIAPAAAPMALLDDYLAVIELSEWTKENRISVSLLQFVLEGVESPGATLEATPEVIAGLVQGVQASGAADLIPLLEDALRVRYNLTAAELSDTYLASLTSIDLTDPGIATALAASFTEGAPDAPADLDALATLMTELERTTRMVEAIGLSAEGLADMAANPAHYGIADPKALDLAGVRSIRSYASLVGDHDDAREADLQSALAAYAAAPAVAGEVLDTVAAILEAPASLVSSVASVVALPAEPVAAFVKLARVVALASTLRVDGFSLQKLTRTDSTGLADARNTAFGAVQAKYPDDAERGERLADLTETTNERRRDALTAFIIGHFDKFKFKDRRDLYQFFLLDADMSGCFMTSRVVCANSSLQTYVNRCLLNLEQSDPVLNPAIEDIAVDPTWIPGDEWDWRRNYRVWEANRRVFLYPETYVDPALRLDKTHLFGELEQEVLQQEITLETAEGAYKRYLAGFTQLANLRYAGAFANAPQLTWHAVAIDELAQVAEVLHTEPPATGKKEPSSTMMLALSPSLVGAAAADADASPWLVDPGWYSSASADGRTYHLFARTSGDPYEYFHRTYRRRGNVWTNWERMELPIEADRISVTIYRGRLYVFWNEVKYKEVTKVKGGDATFGSVRFDITTKYASLDENGSWTSVQEMSLGPLSIPRDDVFFRSIGRFPPDEDEQDRLKEEVYADFIRKAFSKPYATLTSGSTDPLRLSYIWSQEQGVADVVYRTAATTKKVKVVEFQIPSLQFTVTNNHFGESKPVHLKIRIRSFINAELNVTGSMTIINATSASVHIPGWGTLSVSASGTTVATTVFTSATDMSLLRNEIRDRGPIEIDDRPSYRSITHSTRSYLHPEHQLAGGSPIGFFVENGWTTFTGSQRTIAQSDSGHASLALPGGVFGLDHVTLSTVLTEALGEVLYNRGLEAFLSLETQEQTDRDGERLDFDGPYGQYYWEMFFHIPFLIGNHFNANQKFEEAKWWYERVFDPTSPESPADVLPSDHNWRFREFRNKTPDTLRQILVDEEAIDAYREDPFNPHAIAKLRHSAYQKAIVMRYVQNLIDWADSLFARDTRESIAEATILYAFARDVLGDRPVQVGECETMDPLDYAHVSAAMEEESEFLVLLENITINERNDHEFSIKPTLAMKALESLMRAEFSAQPLVRLDSIREMAKTGDSSDVLANAKRRLATNDDIEVVFDSGEVLTAAEAVETGKLTFEATFGQPIVRADGDDRDVVNYRDIREWRTRQVDAVAETLGLATTELADHIADLPLKKVPAEQITSEVVAAFCVPHNADLLHFWDHIDQQLTKIRNCQNIDGVVRSLALLAPPIDPMLLVRGRAAGLSLDAIAALADGSAAPPLYRFSALLPVARQAAQLVQAFGQALLSALEKKDTEQLRLLQLTHERNIQGLTRSVKQRNIRSAERQLTAATGSLARAVLREEYYAERISEGLTGWEVTEQVATHVASGFRIAESVIHLTEGITALIPELGSPFSMKYGGKQLSQSAAGFAAWASTMAGISNQIASSASIEARFQRRSQEWRHQLELAREEVEELEARRSAAEIGVALAEKDLEIHDRLMEQTEEIEEFHEGKFTGLGLYNHLATKLGRAHRAAFNVAQELARAAERAHRFETDSSDTFVTGDAWDPSRSGLLGGEQLMLQLAEMEADHLRTNTRRPELRQTFSLAQIDPQALVELRQTGSCTIRVPQVAFEILYPGQYRRLIKGVRVSIPSVAGPYTNVSAKLTLLKGEVEASDGDPLIERLVAKNDSITLSGAVNDSGMFEFNHRDERYLPFEGAGAISEWRLELPSVIRSFDYDTIADVLLHLDYTALDGDRVQAEADLAAAITTEATTTGLFRLISLRRELPDVWARMTGAAAVTPQDVGFTVNDAYFPHLLAGRDVKFAQTTLYLEPVPGDSVVPPPLSVNGSNVVWDTALDIDRPGMTGDTEKLKGGTVALVGPAKRDWRIDGGEGALDAATTADLLILIRYTVALP